MLDTLIRVLVFFAFIGLGVLLVRFKRLNAQGLDGLSAYFYWIGFPSWLMISFARLPVIDSAMAITIGGYIVAMISAAVIVILTARLIKAPPESATAAGMAAYINNSAFLGIPIALSLFGTEAVHTGPVVVAADFLILFSIGCAGLAKTSGHTYREALMHTARNPTVIGGLIGVVMMLTGFEFLPPVENALDILGKSGPPVALVALGGMLGLMDTRMVVRPEPTSSLAIAGKILLAPALVAIVMALLRVDPATFKVCVFLSATPTAVSVFIQTKMYGTWYEGAARTVAQGTVVSLATLSVLAIVLTHIA